MSVIIGTSRVTCHPDSNFPSSSNPNSYFRQGIAAFKRGKSRIPKNLSGTLQKNSLRNRHQLVFIERARGTRDGGWPPLLFSPRARVGPRNFYLRFKKKPAPASQTQAQVNRSAEIESNDASEGSAAIIFLARLSILKLFFLQNSLFNSQITFQRRKRLTSPTTKI